MSWRFDRAGSKHRSLVHCGDPLASCGMHVVNGHGNQDQQKLVLMLVVVVAVAPVASVAAAVVVVLVVIVRIVIESLGVAVVEVGVAQVEVGVAAGVLLVRVCVHQVQGVSILDVHAPC